MRSYKDYQEKKLQNPEVKAEYDALQPEYDIIQALIDARTSQKELATIKVRQKKCDNIIEVRQKKCII